MENEQILEVIKASLIEGKLHCETAHQIAERHHISLAKIGEICEEKNIRIKACQLGCFK